MRPTISTEPTDLPDRRVWWRRALCKKGTPRSVCMALVVVAVVYAGLEIFAVSASRLWVATDSGTYIRLAAGLAERMDFSQPGFEFRIPGYPLFLAVVFRLFGACSAHAILFLQHGMIVAAVILSAMTAAALRPRVSIVLFVGVLSAADLHLRAYGSTVLTEVPYALALTFCVYALVRYHAAPSARWMILASGAGGVCAIIKGLGVAMPVLCMGVAGYSAWRATRGGRLGWQCRRMTSSVVIAFIPAALLILPVLVNSYRLTGHLQLTCQGSLALYHRAVTVEGFDSSRSPAMAELREAFEERREAGIVRQSETMRDTFQVLNAHSSKHGGTWSDSAVVMGEAARDMLWEHKLVVMRHGARYIYRTLFIPDPYYRVVPGVRALGVFDTTTETAAMSQYVGKTTLNRYFPFEASRHVDTEPTRTSPFMAKVAQWYRHRVDRGSPVLSLADTPYEAIIWLCVGGGIVSVFCRDRFHWLIVGFPIALHVIISSNLGGVMPRYAVPLHPLLAIFGAFALYGMGQVFVIGVRTVRDCWCQLRAGQKRSRLSAVSFERVRS